MIKLSFSNFSFTSDGNVSKGSIKATIKFFVKNKWHNIATKEFTTKIICHKNDKSDLNKAYKYIQAKLEKDAYLWANNEAMKQLLITQKDLKIFNDFVEKSKHIIVHDTHYLSQF